MRISLSMWRSPRDTVVALTNGQKFLVLESAEEIVEKVIEFRRAIMAERCPLQSGRGPRTSERHSGNGFIQVGIAT